jgi:SSS family transporter
LAASYPCIKNFEVGFCSSLFGTIPKGCFFFPCFFPCFVEKMLLAAIGIYLLLTVAIAWWASYQVKSTGDYVMAGRSLPLFIASSAVFATWFGSETIMGAPAQFAALGVPGIIEDPFGAALCLILVGAFFARKFYQLNVLTFIDFFRIRYGRKAELVSAILIVPSYFGWIAAQLVAMAVLVSTLTDVSFVWGVLLCTGLVVGYTFFGGMWAISVTDFLQTIVIIVGLLALAVSLGQAAGGVQVVLASKPLSFYRILPEANVHDIAHYVAAWITIGLGSIPQQDVFQRVMSAKNANTAVKASYIGGILYLTVGLIPMFIVLAGRIVFTDIQPDDPQMTIPMMVMQHSSLPMQVLFFGALLSAILSTTSAAMLAPASIIGENLIRPRFRNISDQSLLQVMRWSMVAVAILSAIMAINSGNIFELVGQSSAFSLVSLFFPLVLGLYWKKASGTGAMMSMISGLAVWLFLEIKGAAFPTILPGAAVGVLLMIIGSLRYPDKAK